MENIRNESRIDQNKVWKILLIIVATFFLAVAAEMIVANQQYYIGILYIITSILYFSSAYLITTGKANIMKGSSSKQMSLVLGFVIIAIGLAMNGIFWGLGFVLFLAAILSIHKSNN